LGKKLAEKVQVFVVRPRHLDAPISFPRNRFQHCGIQESPRDVDDAPTCRNPQRKCCGLGAKISAKWTMFFDPECERATPRRSSGLQHGPRRGRGNPAVLRRVSSPVAAFKPFANFAHIRWAR
jgi:hypothetical protein